MKIDPKKTYTARQAAKFLKVTEATVKRHLNLKINKGLGIRAGSNGRWYMTGKAILTLRKRWKLDAINS